MNIDTAIEMLRNSSLKQIKVGESDSAILGYINLGILELHKRFRLSWGEAVITPVDGKSVYKLDGSDADVSMDLTGFELLAVEQVLDYEMEPVDLNVSIEPKSSKLLSYNTIKLGEEDLDYSDVFTVLYRTSPEFSVSVSQSIPLSSVYLEALFHYVGYQAYLSVNGEENTQHNLHKKRFEESVKRISDLGLHQQNDIKTSKIEQRTFV